MVIVHVRQTEERQFLYEAASTDSVDAVTTELVVVHNLQLQIVHLKEEAQQLALYGPSEPPRTDDSPDTDDDEENKELRGPFYNRDPTHRRSGEACDPEVAKLLTKAVAEADTCASKNQVLYKVPLTVAILKEALQTISEAVRACYPMGLPLYDSVQQIILGTFTANEVLDPDTTHMWWAGKQLMRENSLHDYIGKNEKTKPSNLRVVKKARCVTQQQDQQEQSSAQGEEMALAKYEYLS